MRPTRTPAIPSSFIRRLAASCSILLILLFSPIQLKAQATYKVLYNFTGGADGAGPYATVVLDNVGNLFGTAEFSGANGHGTVFQLSPSQGGWTFNLVYTFTGGTDGGDPIGGVIVDAAGNLYGTTSSGGGFCQCGTVYELTPSQTGWTFQVLHSFQGGTDGAYPGASLAFYNSRLAGTTTSGGRYNLGTAFTLPIAGGQDFVYSLSGTNGNQPWSSLYGGIGTSYLGGKDGVGNVFALYGSKIRAVHAFHPATALGDHPLGNLVSDSSNNLYGTTSQGGVGQGGTVYKMTPGIGIDVYAFSLLHSFSGPDGRYSNAGLVFDASGNLYGTTAFGGADPSSAGTVFKLTPSLTRKWTETLLHSFTGGSDGSNPYGGLAIDGAGNLYGTANEGGTTGKGVVFQITP
jgi:uncharacterized repeat protein (TIGR03803 family)